MNSRIACMATSLLIIILVFAATTALAGPLFNTRQDYAFPEFINCAASGDIDGDGLLDVVVGFRGVIQELPLVSLCNNGDGTFRYIEGPEYHNYGYVALALEDVDLDGDLDAIALNSTIARIFRGNGDGTFQVPTLVYLNENANDIATGDMNGDGAPDLVTSSSNYHNITLVLGNGDGTFGSPVSYALGDPAYYSPVSVAVGDLNNDGYDDVATANRNRDSVSVLLAQGDGTLQPAVVYPAGNEPKDVTFGDLDGDQILDLIAVNYEDTHLTIMHGNGDGTFGEAESPPVPNHCTSATICDLNDDNRMDLAFSSGHYHDEVHQVPILLANGDGTFQQSFTGTPYESSQVIAGDFNSDNQPDLVIQSNVLSLLPGKSDGSFMAAETLDIVSWSGPIAVALADLDGNQNLDLVVANNFDNNAWIFLGNGDGTFQSEHQYWMGSNPVALDLADFNGDGNQDMAMAGWSHSAVRGYVTVRLGNGNGHFQQPSHYLDVNRTYSLASGDLDGDGDLDLAVSCRFPDLYDRISILVGQGDGTFSVGSSYILLPDTPEDLALGDIDGDGHPDLVVVTLDEGTFLMLGNGDNTFQSAINLGHNGHATAIGDLNSDGNPDLVVGNADRPEGGTGATVLLGKGDGTFFDAVSYPAPGFAMSIVLEDINADGSLDIVMGTNYSNVSILPGNGDGTFQNATGYGIGEDALSVALGDLDNDGLPDLAAATTAHDRISLLFGRKEFGTVSADLTCLPSTGTLPFSSQLTVSMTNNYLEQARRIQYQLNVTLAGGQYYSNWRRGWQNVQAGETYSSSWWQTIPAAGSLVGFNHFLLTTNDVTPPPYNLPPYPSAGDSDRCTCSITGMAP